MKCKECNYCKGLSSANATRMQFHCYHPNYNYIYNYFEKHKMSKMPAFIGFGEKFSDKPSIKTSPAWCPLKAIGSADAERRE